MTRSVLVPDCHESVTYNTKDMDDWQFGKQAVIGQGYKSGSLYILIFDSDDKLSDYDIIG